ncbi:MAG: hypothetical protein A2297_06375 [Elusimicrobia bacterium RIFOXYB2_FULL_48_7]|nr:MAG: hypothetical protein A2297_06375 [Elusimicrobia bacterium RIFOXYB2_FULL_48_7]
MPQAVVIYLCTNDFSTTPHPSQLQFETGYYNFIQVLRTKNGSSVEIFCMYNSPSYAIAKTYIDNVVSRCNGEGDSRVHSVDINHVFLPEEKSSDGHYNANGNIVVSNVLSAVMAPILGWSTDTSSPTAPGAVRDGAVAGADAGSTLSTTQLSANWDVSVDTESGISKYWYAIGTTPGGTGVAAWADNGTASTVTKTGITLTVGTTYYFSVKAQNGIGLIGLPANSNGQYAAVTPSTGTPPVVTIPEGIHAYPNPVDFSSNAATKFVISDTTGAKIEIYSTSGRLVRKLTAGAGSSTIDWNGKNEAGEKVSRGIYIYKITGNAGTSVTGKLVLKR